MNRLGDQLDQEIGQLQASIFSAPLIDSLPNTIIRKGRILDNHKPDMEFAVHSLVHVRSSTVYVPPP